jgi:hypothetical protein
MAQWAEEYSEHMDKGGSLSGGIAQYLCMELVILIALQNIISEM